MPRFRKRVPHNGQLDREGRTLSLAFGFGTHAPAVQLDEVADDGEPEPEAAVDARRGLVALAEAVEEVRYKRRSYPGARVLHGDARVRALAPDVCAHLAADGRELDGVREEIPEDLLQTPRVAHDGADARLELGAQGDVLGRRRVAHGVQGRLDDDAQGGGPGAA